MTRLLTTLCKEGEPNIRVITKKVLPLYEMTEDGVRDKQESPDFQLIFGNQQMYAWDVGDTKTMKNAQGFIEIKKSEGYQSKEV